MHDEHEKKDNIEEVKEPEGKLLDGEKPEEVERKEDWEKKYNELNTQHETLKQERNGELRIKQRNETFVTHGLQSENHKLYHRLLDKSEDPAKDIQELKKENPHHFAFEGTNVGKSLPTQDFRKEDAQQEPDHATLGMLG